MAYNSTVYSVKYNRGGNYWGVYVDGRLMVKSENPGGIGGQYEYHKYRRKADAEKKARKFAKKQAERDISDGRVQLQIYNKNGDANVTNYD